MLCRQGFLVEHIKRGPRYRMRLQDLDERRLIDDWTTRSVDQSSGRLHQRKLGGSNKSSGTSAQDEMDGYDVRLSKQLVLGNQCCTRRGSDFRSHVLAPRNDLHAKRASDLCHLAADIAQPKDAEGLAAKVFADRCLPAAVVDCRILSNNVSQARENKRPGQLNCGRRLIPGRGNSDPPLSRGGFID
jgi:hypothetical protein